MTMQARASGLFSCLRRLPHVVRHGAFLFPTKNWWELVALLHNLAPMQLRNHARSKATMRSTSVP
jgi:hypothetical protein